MTEVQAASQAHPANIANSLAPAPATGASIEMTTNADGLSSLYPGTATPVGINPVDKSGVGAAPANEVATGGAAAEREPEPESVTVRVHLPPSITPMPG